MKRIKKKRCIESEMDFKDLIVSSVEKQKQKQQAWSGVFKFCTLFLFQNKKKKTEKKNNPIFRNYLIAQKSKFQEVQNVIHNVKF